MDTTIQFIINTLDKLGPIFAILIASGMVVRYVPAIKKVTNSLIPLLNALIAFLGVFGGAAPPPAQAGMLSGLLPTLSLGGKAAAALLLSALVSTVYEHSIHPVLKQLEKKGWLPAGSNGAT